MPFTGRGYRLFGSRHRDTRRPRGVVTLRSQDLIILRPNLEPQALPIVEVIRHSNGTTAPLTLANAPVLRKGGSADYGRCVVALTGVDVVGGAVAGEAAAEL